MDTKKRRKPVPAKETSIYIYLSLLVILPLILNWKIISYEFTGLDDRGIIENNYGFDSAIYEYNKAIKDISGGS